MIYAALSGGLGNQLFQYAFARHVSSYLNQELVLDTKWYKNRTDRLIQLHYFEIHARLGFSRSELFYHILHDSTIPVVRQLKKILPQFLYNSSYFVMQQKYEFYDFWNVIKPGVYLSGLWQSEKFFEPSIDLVRKDLKFRTELFNAPLIEKSIEMKSSNSVMLHVRRGDYLKLSTYRVLEKEYYIKAVELMLELVDKPVIYIFSDDRDWCRKHLVPVMKSMLIPHHLVDFTKTDMEDFLLMSSCSHSIISNSTFSWWAAWLNNNSNKNVISPAKWFASVQYTETNLFPVRWRII